MVVESTLSHRVRDWNRKYCDQEYTEGLWPYRAGGSPDDLRLRNSINWRFRRLHARNVLRFEIQLTRLSMTEQIKVNARTTRWKQHVSRYMSLVCRDGTPPVGANDKTCKARKRRLCEPEINKWESPLGKTLHKALGYAFRIATGNPYTNNRLSPVQFKFAMFGGSGNPRFSYLHRRIVTSVTSGAFIIGPKVSGRLKIHYCQFYFPVPFWLAPDILLPLKWEIKRDRFSPMRRANIHRIKVPLSLFPTDERSHHSVLLAISCVVTTHSNMVAVLSSDS